MNLTNKILMVRPNTFRSNEQTSINNYFQKGNSKNDDKDVLTKALKEFDDLTSVISKNKIEITVVEGSKLYDNPDEIFPNNWIVFDNNKIGIFPMNALNRRTEINYDLINKINKKNKYKIIDYSNYAEKNIFLEGTGSVVLDRANKKAYCGISDRSSKNLFVEKAISKKFTYARIIESSLTLAIHNSGLIKSTTYHDENPKDLDRVIKSLTRVIYYDGGLSELYWLIIPDRITLELTAKCLDKTTF